MTKLRTSRIAGASIIVAFGAALSIAGSASNVDAVRVFGLEDTTDWTASPGAALGTSPTRTQGLTSLSVQTNGYTTVTSRLVGPLGTVASQVSFDLFVPTTQPNPYWMGAAQLFVSIPSLNVYNSYLGQREITGLSTGAFHQLNFPLDPDLRNKLNGTYYDATFKVVLNVPSGVTDPYLLDNLQISSTIPGRSTMSSADIPRILGFESELDWSTNSGALVLSNGIRSQANFSLRVVPSGYTTVTSVPMTSVAPVTGEISYELRIPSAQPNPYWWGATQLFVSIPSLGVVNAFLGQHELTGLEADKFHRFNYTLTPELQAALNSTSYSDLQFSIVLNVPSGASAHYLDNFHVGRVTSPPAPVTAERRPDIVGHASFGVVTAKIGDDPTISPGLKDLIVSAKSEDGWCEPSATQVCRYFVSVVRVSANEFDYQGKHFTRAVIENEAPFRLSIGGSGGLEVPVPPEVSFIGQFWADRKLAQPLAPTGLYLGISPAGAGLVTLRGRFEGEVDDKSCEFAIHATADTPLSNRMPRADAGPDRDISSASSCSVAFSLDGRGTSDVDQNIQILNWRQNGVVVGRGVTPTFQVSTSGRFEYELEAIDYFGGSTKDRVVVTAALPAHCGAP